MFMKLFRIAVRVAERERSDEEFFKQMFDSSSPDRIDADLNNLIQTLRNIPYEIDFKRGLNSSEYVMDYVDYVLSYMVPSKRGDWRRALEECVDDIINMSNKNGLDDFDSELTSYVFMKKSEFIRKLLRAIIEIGNDFHIHKFMLES